MNQIEEQIKLDCGKQILKAYNLVYHAMVKEQELLSHVTDEDKELRDEFLKDNKGRFEKLNSFIDNIKDNHMINYMLKGLQAETIMSWALNMSEDKFNTIDNFDDFKTAVIAEQERIKEQKKLKEEIEQALKDRGLVKD